MATDPASIIADQQAFAVSTVNSADTLISNLNDLAQTSFYFVPNVENIPSPGYGYDTSIATQDLLLGLFPDNLTVADITGTEPEFTAATVDSLGAITVPDFNDAAPILSMPAVPSSALPIAPSSPSISDPVLPSAPTITMPVSPLLASIIFPDTPSIAIPVFASALPVDDLVVPTNNFTFFEELYTSALLDELKAKLLYDLENGGYGIEPGDEAELFQRARDREVEAALTRVEDAGRAMASRGFPLPPGELSIHIDRAWQEMQDKVSSASRDITLKRADMYVENRKFTIEQTKGLEQILIGYHNSVMERALNAAKATLEAALEIFKAQVSRFNARLDSYKSEGVVFEARVRAALAQVEVYRVQMEGKRIEADVQRVQVEIYNAQLAGVTAVVGLYRVQMEAAQVQANIERLRIESFQALIQAYTAQVQAKVAEFNMYEAGIKGQVARVQAYEAEVRAYTAKVDGAKAKADILIARLRGQIEVANQGVEAYKARLEGYKTNILAQVQTVDAKTRVYGAQVQEGTAKAGAVVEGLRLDVTEKDLEFKRNAENARIAIEGAKIVLQGLVESARSRVSAGGAAAGYYQALISGAVNSINTLSALVASS